MQQVAAVAALAAQHVMQQRMGRDGEAPIYVCGGRGRSSSRGGGVVGGRGLRRANTIADDDHMPWTEH